MKIELINALKKNQELKMLQMDYNVLEDKMKDLEIKKNNMQKEKLDIIKKRDDNYSLLNRKINELENVLELEKLDYEKNTVLYKQNHTQYLIVNTFETPKDDSSMTDAASTTTTPDDQAIDKQTTTSRTGVTTGDTQTTAINESNQSDSQTTVTTARHGSDRHTYPNGNGTTQRRDTVTTPVRPGGGAFPPNSANPNTPHGYNGGGGDVPTVVTEAVPPRHTVVEKLPQTGQLWWPVPILAVSGVVMLGFGLHLMKKDDSE
jgi:hypothetical protein